MSSNSERNFGIDIARILAMLMVVFLHNLLNGGILRNLDINSNPMSMIYWFIENCSIIAVNIFAIVTGYLMTGKRFSYKRVIELWKIVIFWSIFIFIVFYFWGYPLKMHDIITSFFPTIMNSYWYFNAYLILVLFIPFLNAGIKAIDFLVFEKIVFCLVALSVTIGFVGHLFELEGYSGIWLMILYLIGAYIKVSPRIKRLKNTWLLILYLLCSLISVGAEYVSIKFIGGEERWLSYLSPMVTVSSICLFILLTRINIKNDKIKKILIVISPLSFAVYLIDTHPIIFNYVIQDAFRSLTSLNLVYGLIIFFIISILMFALFLLMEYVRVYIFKLMRNFVRGFKTNGN